MSLSTLVMQIKINLLRSIVEETEFARVCSRVGEDDRSEGWGG